MPNTAGKHSGRSLKERIAIAKQLTAEEQASSREPVRSAPAKSEQRGQREQRRHGSGPSAKQTGGLTRRSARLENVKEQPRQKRKLPLPSLSLPAKVGIVALVLVVLSVVILYPAGQTYYQSMREEQRLQAEYNAILERNAVVEDQNRQLETDEGVENQARKEYGWTKEGEDAAVVRNPGDTSSSSTTLPNQVDVDAIHAPQTWYYSILDALFMYHE